MSLGRLLTKLRQRKRNVEVFWESVKFHRRTNPVDQCHWDKLSDTDRGKLITHLDNPFSSERDIIARVLMDQEVKSVVDIGCGAGAELNSYRRHGLELSYLGVDSSRHMLAHAQARFPQEVFMYGDARSLPLQDGAIEAVVMKHVLEHMESYQRAVSEAVRVASNVVIINFFHYLLPIPVDIPVNRPEGYRDNWYSRKRFEEYVQSLSVSSFEKHITIGDAGQTAEIYVLKKWQVLQARCPPRTVTPLPTGKSTSIKLRAS